VRAAERVQIDVRDSLSALAAEGARRFLDVARRAIDERGRFVLSVSGGSTPGPLYDRLGEPALASRIDWARVFVYWGDDRWVPHDHPDSNVRFVRERWLERAPTPPARVYPPATGVGDPDAAAAAYERTLRETLGVAEGEVPVFDLHLMGLGDDGHTASLFPGTAVLDERRALVAAPFVPRLATHRMTLTLPVFDAAREVWFVVSGGRKAGVVRRVLDEWAAPIGPATLPAARVRPAAGRIVWRLDQPAAAALPEDRR
jgi:6-phosphogluconolactonase